METQKVSTEAVIIDAKKYTLFLTILLFGGIGFCVLLVTQMHLLSLAIILSIVIMGSPFLFEKKIKKKFTRNVKILFAEDYFKFLIMNKENGELEPGEEIAFQYGDIRSFLAIDSYKDDSSYLKILMKDGSKLRFTFLGQNEFGKENITAILVKYIKGFNTANPDDKITLMPSFYASKAGFVCIFILSILLTVTIIIHLIYKPKTVLYSLFSGVIIFIYILLQRRKDIKLSKQLD